MVERINVVRHGETEWSKSGRHTGRTEIPLSEEGERKARLLAGPLAPVHFSRVFVSPRQRAQRTCELAGLDEGAEIEPDLMEWDYGDYEGLRSAEILKGRPGWNLFRDGCPDGETPAQVAVRADRLLARVRSLEGRVALFTHGHFGRVLAVRWAGLPAGAGESLLFDTASVGILSCEHQNPSFPVIERWNIPPADPMA
jgi:broad specificity phosphatase PhoE